MKVLNFGSCNIDFVYTVPHFVTPGETISSTELNRFPGGKGLNQSVACARSGINVYHAGCIGTDGEFLRNILTDAGADTSLLKALDIPTGHAIIQVDGGGENNIILFGGANQQISHDFADSVLENFEKGDIIILQNEISSLPYIIDRAFEKGMKIILNPSPFDKSLTELDLGKISVLMLNEVEAFEFSGEKTPEKVQEYFKKFPNLEIVLTLGSRGSCYMSANSELAYCPPFSVKAVDTTSAGDTFTGYYVYGMVNELDAKERLRLASAASALAVSKKGAAVSIPSIGEVQEALKTLTPKDITL